MEERWEGGMGMEGMGRWACDSARFRFLFLFYMDISLLKTPPVPQKGLPEVAVRRIWSSAAK